MSDRARLDVSAPVLRAVTGWIARHRRRRGARPAQRAGTVHTQVVLVLRWLRHRLDLRTLAGEGGLSIATAYRYLHEALDVIAAHAPDLSDVLARARAAGLPFVCLDGTLLRTDRVAARAERGHHLWYSGKHHAFGGSVQVLCDPGGFPLWVSDVRPGWTHDLTAARELVLPALYPHAARGLPVPADKGYTGAASACTCRSATTPTGRCTPSTAATTGCSPRCARPASAATPCSAAGALSIASPSARNALASSPLLHSS